MKQPSALTFWRFVFATISFLALLAFRDLVGVTRQLGIVVFDRGAWIGLFILLGAFILFVLALLLISYSAGGKRLVEFLESTVRGHRPQRWLGGLASIVGLTGFAMFTSNPYFV